jgi:hydrogenase nickel insertion protein HypA
MHEITLCQRALELIEQQATQHGAQRVTGVWLKIGAFSCVETSALSFCFDLVCRGPLQKVVNSTSKNKKPNVGANLVSNTSRY